MIEKKHPNFNRKLSLIMIIGFSLAGLIFCNILEIIKPQIIPTNLGLFMGGAIIFYILIYGFRAGKHVKCPECSAICERCSDEYNKGRKAVCPKCQIIWDLGVSYSSESE